MAEVKVRLDKAMGTSLIMLYGLASDVHAKPSEERSREIWRDQRFGVVQLR